jgi:predicted ester cyclase
MRTLTGAYQTAFPDAHWRIDAMITSGDTVVTRWTGSGTNKGALLGIPPTGARVEVAGIWINRIAGGRIVESWNAWDTLGMFQQLGIVKLPAPAGAAR